MEVVHVCAHADMHGNWRLVLMPLFSLPPCLLVSLSLALGLPMAGLIGQLVLASTWLLLPPPAAPPQAEDPQTQVPRFVQQALYSLGGLPDLGILLSGENAEVQGKGWPEGSWVKAFATKPGNFGWSSQSPLISACVIHKQSRTYTQNKINVIFKKIFKTPIFL